MLGFKFLEKLPHRPNSSFFHVFKALTDAFFSIRERVI
jgi:hypothetical protein